VTKLCCGLLVLVLFQWLGELGVRLSGLTIPGPLLGMILLLVTLSLSPKLLSCLDVTSSLLIRYLALLFIPASVGALFLRGDIVTQFPVIFAVLIISTSLAIAFMALLIKSLARPDE
tara:strand:- start:72 stop:422 length:351 start_codon:yes stop_codon:yes gene_type:complete